MQDQLHNRTDVQMQAQQSWNHPVKVLGRTQFCSPTGVHLNARKESGEACGFAGKIHPAVASQDAVWV